MNARYLILLEASQFKCKETLSFLYKIAACDKNSDLRLMAFYALQKLGEHPWLGRDRKEKKTSVTTQENRYSKESYFFAGAYS